MPFPTIDAHQHVWDPARARYDWLGPELAPIDVAMSFDDVLPDLRASGIEYTVQVQSADNVEDTAVMRASAAAHPQVVGIVGFAPLDRPAEVAAILDSWAGDSLMVGVRNLTHIKPDPDWLLLPEVDEGLAVLEAADVPLDLVPVIPRHLEIVPILSERHPRLRMVIDHLGKPPIGLPSRDPWWSLIAAAAENPLVHAKVSGLYPPSRDPGTTAVEQIRPHVDHALDLFGPGRLMYGGDWPISVLSGGYRAVWSDLSPLFDSLGDEDREQVLGRTAASFYRLDDARLGRVER